MKRLLSILIILSLLLSFVGCKMDSNNSSENNSGDGNENTTPEDKNENTPVETPININGVSIKEYNIVCDSEGLDYNIRAAEYIRDKIYALTNCTVPIVDDSETTKAREIVVGETSREISQELDTDTEGFDFAMLAKDGSIALEADYFAIAAAAYYFVDTCISGGDKEISNGTTVRAPITKEAKNFILLIGDGMGMYQTRLYEYMNGVADYNDGDDYSDGEDLFYGYMFPSITYSRTNSYSGVTDSAAGGTALATGYKTWNKYVGLDKDGNEIKSLTELAGELGKATAVMSTETNTGATPSSFSAHETSRDESSKIRDDQATLTEKYGTIIECNFNYYTSRYMRTSVEKRISDTLAQLDKDEDGFFMMYEEAHIDKHCHNEDIESTFKALVRFNQAIARFMEYAFYNPDTVVIITADHETGGLLPGDEGGLAYTSSGTHTGADVPVFAYGYGTEIFDDNAVIENIDIAKFFASQMGVNDFGDRTDDWYDEIYGG